MTRDVALSVVHTRGVVNVKALVIGASGFIGGAIVRALERDGVQVAGTGCSRAGTGLLPLDLRDARAVSA